MHLPRRFKGRKLWSDGPVWAEPATPAPKPEVPVWGTGEFSRSLSHMVLMGLGLLAFGAALVWFVTYPARCSGAADPPRKPLTAEQALETVQPETAESPSR